MQRELPQPVLRLADRLRTMFAVHFAFEVRHKRLFLAYIAAAFDWTLPETSVPLGRNKLLQGIIGECLAKGIEQGDVDPNANLQEIIDLLLAAYIWAYRLAAWHDAPDLVHEVIDQVSGMYRAKWELTYHRGVPPVVNENSSVELLRDAMIARYGTHAVEDTEQSLGGEDFSWYLEHVPGALARLGVRPVGDPNVRDLHRGDFDADEGAIKVGVELFTGVVLLQ